MGWITSTVVAAMVLAGVALAARDGVTAAPRGAHPGLSKGGAVMAITSAQATITVKSDAFTEGQAIPRRHTGEGEDVSPALTWEGVPAGTKELALICEDPDAPSPTPWVHWVIYKMPGGTGGLPEGVSRKARLGQPEGAMQGHNSWPSNNVGYRGPMPPPGHGRHRYFFRVYALDSELAVQPGLDAAGLRKAMDGHVLAEGQLMGTYQR